MDLTKLSISQIARVISQNWMVVNYAAKPYLQAMFSLNDINDAHSYDTGKSVVLYFLSNASSFRGPVAKAVKLELNKRLK